MPIHTPKAMDRYQPRFNMDRNHFWILFLLILSFLLPKNNCRALEPDQILVVANGNVPDSSELARYYMKKRAIPAGNLLLISMGATEHCNREEYEKQAAFPIRQSLRDRDPMKIQFRCIVTLYGVPLVVSDSGLNMKEKAKLLELRGEQSLLQTRLSITEDSDREKRKSLKMELDKVERKISRFGQLDRTAAVDSELALVRETDFPLSGWLPNPACLGYGGKRLKHIPASALMVSRLDGPSPKIVRRMIEDCLRTEEKGLQGKKAYFDARWPDPGNTELSGYAFYDRSIHRAAGLVRKSGLMTVVLDETERLFQPGECPDAALYCGWYSLGKYVNAFTWAPGAVGYHIASSECTTLKKQNSTVWCKVMLEKGVGATIGPVGEPYVQAFPPPELFFQLLMDGRPTLVECFAMSSPFVSWKIILIGDPLYRPFKSRVAMVAR